MLSELQQKAAMAIINIFETSKVLGDYTSVVYAPGDLGGLTYGRSQTTLNSGNLYLLIKDYCETDVAKFADELTPYLDRLRERDSRLNRDRTLHQILRDAGSETLMQDIQDAFFDRVYWQPATISAEVIGVVTALGTAVIYDSRVHGSWTRMRDRTMNQVGNLSDIGEKNWISKYVSVRRDWLASQPAATLLPRTVYRMDSFKKLISDDQWELALPLTVRGLVINEETLTPPGHGNAQVDEVRLLRLQRPFMRGEDVRKVQEALLKKGFSVEVDDVYGPKTETIVKEFQKQHSLKVDGIVGNATRAALEI
jgi:chitosanase